MSVHITTIYGDGADEPIEIWKSEDDASNIWLVYEDNRLEERIDLSGKQVRELCDALAELS